MTKDKERDDALIAEKERLADILEKKAGNAYYAITSVDLRQAAALLRGDEQPKPDRAEVLVHELWIMDSGPSQSVWLEVVRRHFTELRAEWEAERQDEPVCFIGKVDCDGNELVTVSKDALDRYKDQARYTYQRAEKAEARVKELEAERPAVVVPREAKLWAESRLNKRSAVPLNYGGIAAQYILNGAKGGAATSIDVHQRRGIMATCITLALRDYDEWQKDDDYNFRAALERVINHLEPAREVALQEFSQ